MALHRRPILRDIATKAGVTIATVSMALRDHPLISVARRREIQKIAEEIGYFPDPALSALADYRRVKRPVKYRENLVFLYQLREGETTFDDWRNWPIRNALVDGVRQRCAELGYGLECHSLPRDLLRQARLARRLTTRGVRAVMIHANMQSPVDAMSVFQNFIALNLIDYAERPSFHQIRSNEYESMRLALSELFRRGYRRPLYLRPNPRFGLFGPEKMSALLGWRVECHSMTCQWMDEVMFQSVGIKKLRGKHSPDVLLIHNHKALESFSKKYGIRIPQDIAVCHLFASPQLHSYGGVDIRFGTVGIKAVDIVDLLLKHQQFAPVDVPTTTFIDPVWQDGPSAPLVSLS